MTEQQQQLRRDELDKSKREKFGATEHRGTKTDCGYGKTRVSSGLDVFFFLLFLGVTGVA